jgi:uncharacterized protein (DUF1778 family)
MEQKKVRLDLFVPKDQKDALQAIADKQGRNMTDLIREAIARLIKDYDCKKGGK